MWEPRRLTNVRVSTASYRDSFALFFLEVQKFRICCYGMISYIFGAFVCVVFVCWFSFRITCWKSCPCLIRMNRLFRHVWLFSAPWRRDTNCSYCEDDKSREKEESADSMAPDDTASSVCLKRQGSFIWLKENILYRASPHVSSAPRLSPQ
jgi:hypothetical protein